MYRRSCVLAAVAVFSVTAAAQPQFTPLGRAGYTGSFATAISANATYVAGFLEPGADAFLWSSTQGLTIIPGEPGTWSTVPYAVSSNGVVAGESRFIPRTRTFRWSAQLGMQDLGSLAPNAGAHAWGISDDGQVVVGSGNVDSDVRAFRWTQSTGPVDLNIPQSYALALSADGSTIAGNFNPFQSPGTNLFRWTQAAGVEDLGTVGGNDTYPYAISADGSHIVGTTFDVELFRAFLWSPSTGIQTLDLPPDAVSAAAQDTSDDARLIVGYWIDDAYESRGAIWTPQGAFDLLDYLQSLNTIGLEGWTIRNCLGVSADGSSIVGTASRNGADEAFIVTGLPVSPRCPACPADFDQDGGVTGADLAAFFIDFEAGNACADVDQDGGITGADIGAFVAAYEAGGCA